MTEEERCARDEKRETREGKSEMYKRKCMIYDFGAERTWRAKTLKASASASSDKR